ncbi:MAG: exodeoxyribonuclease VII large subunit [Bacteroidales bacterium]
MANREIISLRELQDKIKSSVEGALPGKIWIRAETGEVNFHSTGHCYIDLIDKEEGGAVRAKIRAVIWASSFRIIRPYFETTTGRSLERGLSILVNAMVQYSALYGLSLVIYDIDPSYTIGEQELKRQQTIAKLKEEGMFGVNLSIPIEPLPRNIAVISSETAAGYRDFMKHLHENDYGFVLNTTLFTSPMQGEGAPAGIIAAMELVAKELERFDLLIIIRGGGAAQDLICFDNYELALNIAQFPLPVITGIGHDHDIHIADMVAHTSVKTPTAAAVFVLDLFIAQDQQLISITRRVFLSLQGRIDKELSKTERIKDKIVSVIAARFREEEYRANLNEKRVLAASPLLILERGFSIIFREGKRVSTVLELKKGQEISLLMKDGKVNCNIKSIQNE